MKFDFSDRSHEKPSKPRYWLTDTLIFLGGGNPEMIREGGPRSEVYDFVICGLVLLGSMILTSMTITTILHFAAGDRQFHPIYLFVGCLAGGLQGTIDNVVQYRARLHDEGKAELRRAGLKLPEPTKRGRLALKFERILRGGAIGALAGITFLLSALAPGIEGHQRQVFLHDNRALVLEGAKAVDAPITRTADDLKASTARINELQKSLIALQQDTVRRLRSNVRVSPQSGDQTALLEKSLAAETVRRDALREALSQQEAARNGAIERYVLNAPNMIPRLSGLSGALQSVTVLTSNDWKLLIFVICFQLISLGLELGPMWIGASRIPSTYAVRVALRHFVDVTKLGEEGARQLGVVDTTRAAAGADLGVPKSEAAQQPANDNPPPQVGAAIVPPRRGRGRPRKNGFDQPGSEVQQ